ncbi:hypothetical protein IG193_07410 [Infirmifilum lucidum]|uniref:Uncharacterized protein n=1 Tax=Infirmifilum lucidum TaxID=2776706 RepID=A0A7L9FI28_9CREN|nr:hypothetical protein [Infirmifilum lucidum]QOJ78576.1 hypothetical protein IG193_07410 [Infirmifilum lucidum]
MAYTAEIKSAKGLTIEGLTSLVILAVLLFLFSTSLWISIPQTSRLQISDIIIVILVALFIRKSEKLVSPFSAVVSLGLHVDVKKVSVLLQGFLRFIYLVVAYFSLKRTSLNVLTLALDSANASVVYDAVFTVLILLNFYDTVRKVVK